MKDIKDVIVSCKITADMKEALENYADKEENTMSAVIRKAIKAFLNNNLKEIPNDKYDK